jgi:hypothetical protein
MARDTKALTDECEFFDEPTDDMKRAALRTLCGHAKDASEASEFALMLGVHPSQLNDASRVPPLPGRFV